MGPFFWGSSAGGSRTGDCAQIILFGNILFNAFSGRRRVIGNSEDGNQEG